MKGIIDVMSFWMRLALGEERRERARENGMEEWASWDREHHGVRATPE